MTSGTSAAIFIPRDPVEHIIKPGDGYFTVRIHGGQVVFGGHIWEVAKNCVITTSVDLHHPTFGGTILSIRRINDIIRNKPSQLGLNTNLIDLIPAIMPNITINLDFMVDRENRLALLAKLINTDTFLATISFSPAQAIAAKTISEIARKIVETMIPQSDQVPALQFRGDFNISTEGLRNGYYAILSGSKTGQFLPGAYQQLEIRNHRLLINDVENVDLSYVILDVACVTSRTRELNGGAVWNEKLRQAEDLAHETASDPLSSVAKRNQTWKRCLPLLSEARNLIRNDPNYLQRESDDILASVYSKCANELRVNEHNQIRRDGILSVDRDVEIDTPFDRQLLELPVDEQSFQDKLDNYAEQVFQSREILQENGLL